jgi:formate hydrogenlyase subunit 4
MGLASACVMLSGMDSGSPYAFVGSAREMMTAFVVEPVLFIALVTLALKTHSFRFAEMALQQQIAGPSLSLIIAGAAVFLAIQAQLGKLPFDIPEAEGELMGGPFIETSGPTYAMFRWGFLARQVIFTLMLVQLFFPWPAGLAALPTFLIQTAKILVIIVLVGVVDAVNPRLRIDQSIVYYFGVILTALVGLVFAIVGA